MNRRTPLTPRKNADEFQGPPAYMQKGGPFFFSIRLAWSGWNRSAIIPFALWIAQSSSTFRNAQSGGPRLGRHLGPFYELRNSLYGMRRRRPHSEGDAPAPSPVDATWSPDRAAVQHV